MENLRGDFTCVPACEQTGISHVTELLDDPRVLETSKAFFDRERGKHSVLSMIINTKKST